MNYEESKEALQIIIDDHSLIAKYMNAPVQHRISVHGEILRIQIEIDEYQYAIKILVHSNSLQRMQRLEMAMTEFLQKRFYDLGKTPGLCPNYYITKGNNISIILGKMVDQCPSLQDSVTGNHNNTITGLALCHIMGYPNYLSYRDYDKIGSEYIRID